MNRSHPLRAGQGDPRDVYQRALGAPIPVALDAAPPNPKKRAKRQQRRGSRPNAGIEAEYHARMERLVAEMAASVLYWTKAIYRANEPATVKLAMDGTHVVGNAISDYVVGSPMVGSRRLGMDRKSAAEQITEAFAKLAKRWQAKFDEAAPRLARWFATAASKRSDATLQRILKDGGFTVRFKMTPAAADIIDAAVAENVALIRSIPQQYLTQVEGAVMRSVRQGRDLGPLAKELRKQYGVTKRRAALIARDQNNKATADMTRARQVEKGYRAIWRHSHAGKVPRPTHVANDGKVYDPVRGWRDPAINKLIWPGTEVNCRCFSQTIIPGFEP
jgi:SPP1 gp7 family putative phage head morphogenesis protein